MTKLYAINDNKQTIVMVNLDSICIGSIQIADQQTARIILENSITLKVDNPEIF